jgi:hypothetical protein
VTVAEGLTPTQVEAIMRRVAALLAYACVVDPEHTPCAGQVSAPPAVIAPRRPPHDDPADEVTGTWATAH